MASLKEKYPTSNHAPNPSCERCGGTGERVHHTGRIQPCICIYVDHSFASEAAQMITDVANRELHKLRKEKADE